MATMVFALAAHVVLLLHAAFIAFVMLGGLLVLWRRAWMWPHLAAVLWAAAISLAGWVCPLTPLENSLRLRAGLAGYEGSFIEHYLLALIYPAGLTRDIQTMLGIAVIVCNLIIYAWVLRRCRA